MARTLRTFAARFRRADQRLTDVLKRGSGDDPAAFLRDLEACHGVIADLYREARRSAVGEIGGIVWTALYQAERVHRDEAREAQQRAAKVLTSGSAQVTA